MKRSLMLIIAVFAVTPIFSFYAFAEESAKEIKLIYKKTNPTKIHRSPDFAEVEAWYDSSSMTVTVEGCELKDTFIYIMSPDGLIFAQTSCYFGITPGTCTIALRKVLARHRLPHPLRRRSIPHQLTFHYFK